MVGGNDLDVQSHTLGIGLCLFASQVKIILSNEGKLHIWNILLELLKLSIDVVFMNGFKQKRKKKKTTTTHTLVSNLSDLVITHYDC